MNLLVVLIQLSQLMLKTLHLLSPETSLERVSPCLADLMSRPVDSSCLPGNLTSDIRVESHWRSALPAPQMSELGSNFSCSQLLSSSALHQIRLRLVPPALRRPRRELQSAMASTYVRASVLPRWWLP